MIFTIGLVVLVLSIGVIEVAKEAIAKQTDASKIKRRLENLKTWAAFGAVAGASAMVYSIAARLGLS